MRETVVRAVDGVDLAIARGRGVGLVGESGCGKSTLGRMAAGMLPPSAGRVRVSRRGDRRARRRRRRTELALQMIFQDPMASLNPRMRVIDIVGEAPVVHGIVRAAQKHDYVDAMLLRRRSRPELSQPLSAPVLRRPARRASASRARWRCSRDFLVCDEPVAALDVSIQAQVLNLFMRCADELRLTLSVHQPRPRRGRASLRPRS